MGTVSGAAIALCLASLPAFAMTPPPPCDGAIESGMEVSGVEPFGFDGSGFVAEKYRPGLIVTPHPEGLGDNIDAMPVPVAGMDSIYGYRVMDCRSREYLAFDTMDKYEAEHLLATEFLRNKAQNRQQFSFSDVKRAAEALYRGRDVKIMTLRETEQTCGCAAYSDNLPAGN